MATTKYWALVYRKTHLDEGYFFRKVANVVPTSEKWEADQLATWVEVTGDLKTAMTDPSDTRIVDDQRTRYSFESQTWDAFFVKPSIAEKTPADPQQSALEYALSQRETLLKEAAIRKKVRDITPGFAAAIDAYVEELNNLEIVKGKTFDLVWPIQPWSSSVTSNSEAKIAGEAGMFSKYYGQTEFAPGVTPRFSSEGYVNGQKFIFCIYLSRRLRQVY